MTQFIAGTPRYILERLFEDIENCAVVAGRSEYLPLTRRIERGRTLQKVQGRSDEDTLARILSQLERRISKLSRVALDSSLEEFISQASIETEVFIDNPSWDCPPSISAFLNSVLGNSEAAREEAWQCFYLLSLLPPTMREVEQAAPNSEFREYITTIQAETTRCKTMLVQGTLRYAVRMATYYLGRGVPYIDLVQEALIGLMIAADRYRERERPGAHFQHYAANWMRQRITRYLDDHSRLIRVPVHRLAELSALDQEIQALYDQVGRYPSDIELFLHMEWLNEEDLSILKFDAKWNRFDNVQEKLNRLRVLRSYCDKPLSKVPIDALTDVKKLASELDSLVDRLGHEPDDVTLFSALGWLTLAEIKCLEQPGPRRPDEAKLHGASSRLEKARKLLAYYRLVHTTHLSIEQSQIRDNESGQQRDISEYLAADDDPEDEGSVSLLKDSIVSFLSELPERNRQMFQMRFGLRDGESRTLEEVGQHYGLTRERVRQIESKTLRQMRASGLATYKTSNLDQVSARKLIGDQLLQKMLRTLPDYTEDTAEYDEYVGQQSKRIERLIDKHIMRGRKRLYPKHRAGSRAQMAKSVLQDAGKPMHYTDIHDHILERLPPDLHYPKERTYAVLFYKNSFQLLGNGVFGLVEWDYVSTDKTGAKILHHCPRPLLPENADSRAFFESIMIGRDILTRRPEITAKQFMDEMNVWARQSSTNGQTLQSAFDAWYAAGLVEHVEIPSDLGKPLELAVPADAKLNDVRMHCVEALSRRIRKMPELLLTLTRIAQPTLPEIQRVLFASEQAGFDVPERLRILAALEAVQWDGMAWRITRIGELALEANPPQELPDFSLIDESLAEDDDEVADELSWEEELGLLDL